MLTSPLFWTLAAGLGALFGYANPWGQLPALALLLPAVLAALGLAAPTPWTAFKQTWRAGSVASLVCLYWVYWPVMHYGEVNWALALPVPVLLAMGMGGYFGLFGLMAQLSNRLTPILGTLFLGLAWVAMELTQATLLSGFSWLTLASAFVPWPILVQAASVIGAHGVSGVLAMTAVGLVLGTRSKACLALALCGPLALAGYGWLRMDAYTETTPAHSVALVQGNIDQSIKWDPTYQTETVAKYLRLSRDIVAKADPELIVWPETSMPFYFQDETPLRKPALDFVRNGKAALMVGAPAYERTTGPGSFVLYNRAFLLTPQGAGMDSYDKEHLVPFGEYVPLSGLIPLPLDMFVSGVGDFVSGRNDKALKAGDLALGVLICYEAIFANLAQERVARGANVLINISNDAWFGATSAPHQHLQLTALRAIEQGRYVVRSTNTGLSAFIDPLGRIRLAGSQFQELAAAGMVHPRTELTPFHVAYMWLLGALWTLMAVFAILIIRSAPRADQNRSLR
ncbi:MAG TPA: apolipoprotein N-acyltransferase [Humidesulfovibrio sp.]|uniref:apolipoprotein N-acyltransferase n=1 Tax=Humidesulfovibrio sp. TaxID=2910988 RepID=UPI002B7023BC|nr:apolipoprotein N-acyltransferase [Humidesulfovibrio sp.]HWR02729.1 apolipoprotein N-acyltransferase [Humidesulfovibrio sp.]